MKKIHILFILLTIFLLIAFIGKAMAQTAIWDATDRTPATATMRLPVDINTSSPPGYIDVLDINNFVIANPPGTDSQVFFNDQGSWSADAGFLFNSTSNDLTLTGNINVTDICDEGAAGCVDINDIVTGTSTDTFTNKSGSNSQWTNDEGYMQFLTDDTTPQLSGFLDGQNNYVENIYYLRYQSAGSAPVCTAALEGAMFYNSTSNIFNFCDGSASRQIFSSGGTGLANVVEDTTPELGGQLNYNSQCIGDGTDPVLCFSNTVSADNYVQIFAPVAGNEPFIQSKGSDTNIDLTLTGKNTGNVCLGDGTDTSKQLCIEVQNQNSGAVSYLSSGATTSKTWTLPDITGEVLTDNSTATLTNKSGSNNQWTNDAGYITATLTEEQVEDYVGGMLGGTETLITVTYQDTTNDIDFVVDNDLSNYSNATSAFITASSSDALTNKTGNISQWTNDTGYLVNLSDDTTPDLGGTLSAGGLYGIDNLDSVEFQNDFSPAACVAGQEGRFYYNSTDDKLEYCDGATRQQLLINNEVPEVIQVAISDETTALTTGTEKLTFRMPYAMTLTDIRASVGTAPTGATIIIDVHESGTTIMTTNKLSIDVSEKTTETAATAPTLTDTALADDAEITIDIDQVGSTVAGAGAKVTLIGYRTY